MPRKNSTETTLKNMSKKYKVPVSILKQVVRRGRGAFYSSGSRPAKLQHLGVSPELDHLHRAEVVQEKQMPIFGKKLRPGGSNAI